MSLAATHADGVVVHGSAAAAGTTHFVVLRRRRPPPPPPPQRAGAVVMHCILHVDGDVDDNDDGRPCRVDNASAKFSYIGLGTRRAQWRGRARPSAMSECQLSP